eukprot:Tbor_TRINITY_DN5079_c0_g1::TRINITY_DN5079_c0_g1_i1::g.14299::m.14299
MSTLEDVEKALKSLTKPSKELINGVFDVVVSAVRGKSNFAKPAALTILSFFKNMTCSKANIINNASQIAGLIGVFDQIMKPDRHVRPTASAKVSPDLQKKAAVTSLSKELSDGLPKLLREIREANLATSSTGVTTLDPQVASFFKTKCDTFMKHWSKPVYAVLSRAMNGILDPPTVTSVVLSNTDNMYQEVAKETKEIVPSISSGEAMQRLQSLRMLMRLIQRANSTSGRHLLPPHRLNHYNNLVKEKLRNAGPKVNENESSLLPASYTINRCYPIIMDPNPHAFKTLSLICEDMLGEIQQYASIQEQAALMSSSSGSKKHSNISATSGNYPLGAGVSKDCEISDSHDAIVGFSSDAAASLPSPNTYFAPYQLQSDVQRYCPLSRRLPGGAPFLNSGYIIPVQPEVFVRLADVNGQPVPSQVAQAAAQSGNAGTSRSHYNAYVADDVIYRSGLITDDMEEICFRNSSLPPRPPKCEHPRPFSLPTKFLAASRKEAVKALFSSYTNGADGQHIHTIPSEESLSASDQQLLSSVIASRAQINPYCATGLVVYPTKEAHVVLENMTSLPECGINREKLQSRAAQIVSERRPKTFQKIRATVDDNDLKQGLVGVERMWFPDSETWGSTIDLGNIVMMRRSISMMTKIGQQSPIAGEKRTREE